METQLSIIHTILLRDQPTRGGELEKPRHTLVISQEMLDAFAAPGKVPPPISFRARVNLVAVPWMACVAILLLTVGWDREGWLFAFELFCHIRW